MLALSGLTSIDKDVAKELAKMKGCPNLNGLTKIDREVAKELARFKGRLLALYGLISIDKDVLKILKSNPEIELPYEYSDLKGRNE